MKGPIDDPSTIITRLEAAEGELKFYYDGKPCRHGHMAWRYTSTGSCIKCLDVKTLGRSSRNPDNPHLIKFMPQGLWRPEHWTIEQVREVERSLALHLDSLIRAGYAPPPKPFRPRKFKMVFGRRYVSTEDQTFGADKKVLPVFRHEAGEPRQQTNFVLGSMPNQPPMDLYSADAVGNDNLIVEWLPNVWFVLVETDEGPSWRPLVADGSEGAASMKDWNRY